ncbi:MAG: acetate--CoA ligase family protein [Planctomycetota bacterium]
MAQPSLAALFAPTSVAVFGASDRPNAVGAVVWQNLRACGFEGARYAINPNRAELFGERVYKDLASLPTVPDLAILCTPPATVPSIVEQLAARGVGAAIVLTAGLDAGQKSAILASAQRTGLRILGPNCIGALAPHHKLNASFAHKTARKGELAFVTQSGALMTAMLDWATSRNLGFSHFVSLGDQLDIDCADLLSFLATDEKTRAILLYIESVSDSQKFLAAAEAAARQKPVIVVKAGRSEAGSRAAASHTGALAGSDLVFDAAVRSTGMLRVNSVHELFLAAETLACLPAHRAERLTVMTNGGGAGVLAADACAHLQVPMAELKNDLKHELDALLPANWSHANPVDILGDAPVQRYVDVMQHLLAHEETGTILFVHAPTAIVPSAEIAAALLPFSKSRGDGSARVMSCWLGDDAVHDARAMFRDAGLADYDTPEEAVRAFSFLQTYRKNQQLLARPRTPPARKAPFGLATIRSVIDAALREGREWLLEDEAKTVLAAAGIPVVATLHTALSDKAAVAAASELGYPVVLKILSPDLLHKSDLGGVRLDLEDATAVADAANSMLVRLRRARPDARLQGFSVQTMVRQRAAIELILGVHSDPTFGPVILFGHGGTAVELFEDRAIALPPLDETMANALIDRTRVARLLAGYRDQPPADRHGISMALVALSRLVAEVPEIAELDVNPLLASDRGVLALDARIRVSASKPGGTAHFALRDLDAENASRRTADQKVANDAGTQRASGVPSA